MREKRTVIIFIVLVTVLITSILYINVFKTKASDAIRFKQEYEKLNGMEVQKGLKYNEISIKKDNPVKYSDFDEVIDIIKSGTGVIYLGFPKCPWCRTAIPVLLDVLKDNDITSLYYIDIENERDSYVVEDDKLVYEIDDEGNEIKGSEGYFKLLEALDSNLSDYKILYNDKEYDTNEKRIYAPTMIFVRKGKIIGLHVSTVATQASGFDKLSDEEYDELYDIYEEYVLKVKGTSCDLDSSC